MHIRQRLNDTSNAINLQLHFCKNSMKTIKSENRFAQFRGTMSNNILFIISVFNVW